MQHLVLRNPAKPDSQALEIVARLEQEGFTMTAEDARRAWEAYSATMCAVWLDPSWDSATVMSRIEPFVAAAATHDGAGDPAGF